LRTGCAAAAYTCRHDRDLSGIGVREARHDGIVAVVVSCLPLRSIDHPVGPIGSIAVSDPEARHAGSFRIAAFNFLNHALNSFGTGYAQQTSLTLNGTTTANAAYSPSSGSGFAPYKLGHRLLEVSAKFTF